MEFYRIPCKVAAVGGVLEITCPENDCIIYRNLFRQYVDLRCDITREKMCSVKPPNSL